jgi:hypothetical protein
VKIAIVTDAWRPQTNGVVQTLSTTAQALRVSGHDVLVIEPNQFRTFPCPTYPEIRLAWLPYRRMAKLLRDFAPDCIHIATEATLGMVRAAGVCAIVSCSRPRITRSFLSTCGLACRFRWR